MAYNLPEIHQAILPGGIKLLGVEYDRVPWISLTFMAKRGAETDPLDKPGVADWAAELLTLGTARRTQLQLAEDILRVARTYLREDNRTVVVLKPVTPEESQALGPLQ